MARKFKMPKIRKPKMPPGMKAKKAKMPKMPKARSGDIFGVGRQKKPRGGAGEPFAMM